MGSLGYEIVHLEVNNRQKMLRLYIDHPKRTTGIGIEDCVKVTNALDEPLEKMSEVEKIFGSGGYELEVSSPGLTVPSGINGTTRSSRAARSASTLSARSTAKKWEMPTTRPRTRNRRISSVLFKVCAKDGLF